jgi:hypothetical protein
MPLRQHASVSSSEVGITGAPKRFELMHSECRTSACKNATPPERKRLKPVGARFRINVSARRGSFSSESRRGCSLNGKLLIA